MWKENLTITDVQAAYDIVGTSYGVAFSEGAAIVYNSITKEKLYENFLIDDEGKVVCEDRTVSFEKSDETDFFFSLESDTIDVFGGEVQDGNFFLILYKTEADEEIIQVDHITFPQV